MFKHFEVFTDNQALLYLPSKANLNRREARWMEFLADFHFSIHRVSGAKNPADALRCNAAFAILYCAEAAVHESTVRLYAVVTVTDLVIRPRGRWRGSANFDLDRSKLRFASLTVDSPRLETQDKTRQSCVDNRSPRAVKRVIFQAWVRGESAGTQSSSGAEARPGRTAKAIRGRRRYENSASGMAPSWKSFSFLEGTQWI